MTKNNIKIKVLLTTTKLPNNTYYNNSKKNLLKKTTKNYKKNYKLQEISPKLWKTSKILTIILLYKINNNKYWTPISNATSI